jgi:hypothetical protein
MDAGRQLSAVHCQLISKAWSTDLAIADRRPAAAVDDGTGEDADPERPAYGRNPGVGVHGEGDARSFDQHGAGTV